MFLTNIVSINNGDANAFIERDYTEDCLSTGHPNAFCLNILMIYVLV